MNQTMIVIREGGMPARRIWQVAVLALAMVAAVAGPARAVPIVYVTGFNGTGVNYSSTVATQDANWSIAALPVSGTAGSLGSAWIFTGAGGGTNVPGGWLGAVANTGTNGNHWIGVQANNTSSLIGSGTIGQSYAVIFETKFNASVAGSVALSLDIAVDNRAKVFVGGSITGTDTDNPTITGGQPLFAPAGSDDNWIWNVPPPTGTRAFSILQTASGTVNVDQGENRLYVVVQDYITTGTTFGSIGLLVTNPVPEPSTFVMALAGIGFGGVGWRVARRQRRRQTGEPAVVAG